ncbi:hypothetical protein E4U42_000830 [Claviceps africana]|uniref:Uncharacterized protein n=1 Tax=Claviceps africana TaxID=83212 RepID=A0A8K0NN42_9HYPO|nr:hypothetical protein E4U42_000830 [Claviceps africana]
MLDVPKTEEELNLRFGPSALTTSRSLFDILALFIRAAFGDVDDICDRILALAVSAPEDYDDIFDGVKRLYKEETNNSQLRNATLGKINARLNNIRLTTTAATAVRTIIANCIDVIDLTQRQMKDLWNIMFSSVSPASAGSATESVNIQAMSLKDWIFNIRLTVGTTGALQELQKAGPLRRWNWTSSIYAGTSRGTQIQA